MSPATCHQDSSPIDAAASDSQQLTRTGYHIIRELVPMSCVKRIERELRPWIEKTPACEGDFYGWRTTRVNAVLFKAPATHALATHPRVLALMNAILGPHCDWFQINLSQVIEVHPGERRQYPHRDDDMWPCPKSHEYMVNVMWALSDFTAENGATLLWPSQGTDCAEPVAAEMPAGSALIYLGSTQHCAGTNQTALPRTGLIFSYSLGWLKPYENPFLSYPPEIARTFPKELRALLGYRIHRPNLGHYEGQDPEVALAGHSRCAAMRDALPPAIAQQLARYYTSCDS